MTTAIETTPQLCSEEASALTGLFRRMNFNEAAAPSLLLLPRQQRRQQRPARPQLVLKAPGPNGRLLPAGGGNPGKVARATKKDDDDEEQLEEVLQLIYERDAELGWRRRLQQPSIEQIERDLRQCAAEAAATAAVLDSPGSVAAPSESSGDEAVDEDDALGDTQYHQLARREPSSVMQQHLHELYNGSLTSLLVPSLRTSNQLGQTPLMLLVASQNPEEVQRCCLFVGSMQELFPCLVEAALMPSDEIFYAILRKMCLVDHESDGAARLRHLLDWRVAGWQFLNSELSQFQGGTLEQLLSRNNKTARLRAVRRAAAQQQQQQQQLHHWTPPAAAGPAEDEPEDFLKKLLEQ